MSWLSENYDKAAIGGAAIVALGIGALVGTSLAKVEEDFALKQGKGGENSGAPNQWKAERSIKSLDTNHVLTPGDVDGRTVDLFVGVPLFVRANDLDATIDPLAKNQDDIHEGIPNKWWIDNRLDPGFDNSADQDADGDGFTNFDEFSDETDPRDPKDHPPLYKKLAVVKIETQKWLMEVKSPHNDEAQMKLSIVLDGRRRAYTSDFIKSGALFPNRGPYENQFKLTGLRKVKELNPRTQVEETIYYADVQDMRQHMLNRVYVVKSGRGNGVNRGDRAVVLALRAIGEEANEFKVGEGKTFSLPTGGAKKNYRVLEIQDDDTIVVEHPLPDGQKGTKEIVPEG